MMQRPKVSVIVPVYNMEQYLNECVDSVLDQTLDEIEIIIVDDGSTDSSEKIMETYKSEHSSIRVIKQEREGSGAARNKGLSYATGEYVTFMDSDDYYATEQALEILYNGAKANNVKAAGGNVLRDANGIISKIVHFQEERFEEDKVVNYREFQGSTGHQRYLFDREMLLHGGIRYPNYKRFQDPVFLVKALDMAKRIWITKDNVYVYRSLDKTVQYEDGALVRDVAKGIYDVTEFASVRDYEHIIDWLVGFMSNKMKIHFLRQIIAGDDELYCILHRLDDLLSGKKVNIDGYYFGLSKEDMEKQVDEYRKWVVSILEKVRKKRKYIIYGAGEVGRCVYDCFQSVSQLEFKGFVVSNLNPKGTARGHRVQCIDEYISERKSLTVIVAALNPLCTELKENAERLGFTDIITIDKEIYPI